MGFETNDLMRSANKDLREQRDVLHNVSEKNAQVRGDLEKGRKLVDTMMRREFLYRVGLHFTILLLILLMLTLIIVKIVK